MYKGDVNDAAFLQMISQLVHPACYNGNINSLDDFQALSHRLPGVTRWMIGRGLIANPLLLNEIRTNRKADLREIKTAISMLHDQLVYQQSIALSGESHIMNKLKPYWDYFGMSLPEKNKGLKRIKKASSFNDYSSAVKEVLSQ